MYSVGFFGSLRKALLPVEFYVPPKAFSLSPKRRIVTRAPHRSRRKCKERGWRLISFGERQLIHLR